MGWTRQSKSGGLGKEEKTRENAIQQRNQRASNLQSYRCHGSTAFDFWKYIYESFAGGLDVCTVLLAVSRAIVAAGLNA